MTTDFISGLVSAKSLVNKIGGGLLALGIILSFFSLGWGIGLTLTAIIVLLGTNTIYIIPQGYYGYVMVMEKDASSAKKNGWGLKIPVISTLTLVSADPYVHTEELQVQNANNDNTGITYTLSFNFKRDKAHQLKQKVHSLSPKDYAERFLCPAIREAFGDICSQKTNGELSAQRSQIAQDVLRRLGTDNFVENISLTLGENLHYSPATEKANEQLAAKAREAEIAKAERSIVEERAEQLKISAQAKADAMRIEAEAEADAFKLKGDSENEIRKNLGKILKNHPELIKEELAKNFPKVFGGNSIINLDDILGK